MQHLFPSYNHTRCPQQTCPYHCQASAIPMSNLRPSPLPFLCLHQALSGMLTLSTSLEKYRYSFSFLFLHLEKAKKKINYCAGSTWVTAASSSPWYWKTSSVHYWNTRGSFLPVKTYIKCDSAPAQCTVNASKGEWHESCAERQSADGSREHSSCFQGASPLQQEQK